jgi:hypothetical protein
MAPGFKRGNAPADANAKNWLTLNDAGFLKVSRKAEASSAMPIL